MILTNICNKHILNDSDHDDDDVDYVGAIDYDYDDTNDAECWPRFQSIVLPFETFSWSRRSSLLCKASLNGYMR
jgi:hypothetical protein